MADKVATIMPLPMFNKWTRMALEKVTLYFEQINYKYGHQVYSEGDQSTYIYYIHRGDFEILKDVC